MNELAFEVHMEKQVDEAITQLSHALKDEGFGVLTRIDVQATMKEKLGEEYRRYWILGACNPSLAFKALSIDPRLGLMLPCNITVEEDQGGGSTIRIANPEMMILMGEWKDNPALNEIAQQARARLERVSLALRN
jgi:uncharacterized protein (DUF302 family)